MHRANPAPPLANSPSPPPQTRQSKAVMQKQYREKEVDCFNTLRDIIKQITKEELQTRYDILTKGDISFILQPGDKC